MLFVLPSFMVAVSCTQGLNSFKTAGRTAVSSDSYQQVMLSGLSWYILTTSVVRAASLKKTERAVEKKNAMDSGIKEQWLHAPLE